MRRRKNSVIRRKRKSCSRGRKRELYTRKRQKVDYVVRKSASDSSEVLYRGNDAIAAHSVARSYPNATVSFGTSNARDKYLHKSRNMGGRLKWGKTEFSRGPLKSKAAVLALAKRLQAKRSPYAQHAGDYAQRYWDSILAQPGEQRRLLEIAARYPSPKRRTRRNPKGRRKLASRIAKRVSRQHRLWERRFQSHMGFLPYSSSGAFVKRKGRTYRPYMRSRVTTSEVLSAPRFPWRTRRQGSRLMDWWVPPGPTKVKAREILRRYRQGRL